MDNQIQQIHRFDKRALEASGIPEFYIQTGISSLDTGLAKYISEHFPVDREEKEDIIEIKRELFIFTREQLSKFINEQINKQYEHEV